jgi:hypothetical protein
MAALLVGGTNGSSCQHNKHQAEAQQQQLSVQQQQLSAQ